MIIAIHISQEQQKIEGNAIGEFVLIQETHGECFTLTILYISIGRKSIIQLIRW